MTFAVENLYPLRDGADLPIENEAQYAARIARDYLPNFPADVLGQWFHRHWPQIGDYFWLGFQSLKFGSEPEIWPSDSIPGKEAYAADGIMFDHNADFYRSGKSTPNFDNLREYMTTHGTWPRPIILLHSTCCIRTPRSELPLKMPLHLLEGHKRLAIFHVLKEQRALAPVHQVWVARKE